MKNPSSFGIALAVNKGGLPHLITTVAPFTDFKTHTSDEDPNVPGGLGRMTVADATRLVREHLAADTRLRNVTAEPYGAVTLHQATKRITLNPGYYSQPKSLTRRQADDLLLIAHDGPRATIRHEKRRGWIICCGLRGAIPPAATERLIARGWIVTTGEEGAPVTVSLAGVVALTWRYCKESNVSPNLFGEQIAEQVVDVYSPDA